MNKIVNNFLLAGDMFLPPVFNTACIYIDGLWTILKKSQGNNTKI